MEYTHQILVVEDDETVRLLTVDALNTFGFSTLGVCLGHQALAKLPTLPNLELLITDLGLPDISGLQLAKKFKQQRPNIQVLLASGYIQNGHIRQPKIDDIDHVFEVISKPFTLEQLHKKVTQLLIKI